MDNYEKSHKNRMMHYVIQSSTTIVSRVIMQFYCYYEAGKSVCMYCMYDKATRPIILRAFLMVLDNKLSEPNIIIAR